MFNLLAKIIINCKVLNFIKLLSNYRSKILIIYKSTILSLLLIVSLLKTIKKIDIQINKVLK